MQSEHIDSLKIDTISFAFRTCSVHDVAFANMLGRPDEMIARRGADAVDAGL